MTIICFPPAVRDTILQLQPVPLCAQAPGCLTGSFYLPESRLAGLVLLPSQYLQVRIRRLTGSQIGHCPTGYPGTGAAAYCIGLGYLVSVLSNHQVVSRKHVSILVFSSWSVFTVTTDRCQFILFHLFYFPFFLFLFAYLRFGSHFRSHDSHVTGEHMVELGAIFCCCFFCKSKQFFNVQGHVHCILKVTSLVQVREAVFRE